MTLLELWPEMRVLIRTDGSTQMLEGKQSFSTIYQLIGCDCLDTVSLAHGLVMLVDDTGLLDNKPVNPIATGLYYAKCQHVTPNSIHGDVVIVPDDDYGP